MCKEGHAFRGEYLNACSQVEAWAMMVFASAAAAKSLPARKRSPHLFGEKLKIVTELAGATEPAFSKPKRVTELMTKFEPYAKLRSDLAHATMTAAGGNGETIFAFSNPTGQRLPIARERIWLTPSEASLLLSDLKQLAKEICDQKVRS